MSQASSVASECLWVAEDFGLGVSIPKTKLMVVGKETTKEDRAPLHINNMVIEFVTVFLYLGSIAASSGRVDTEVDKRIAQASKAFGALRKAVFSDGTLYVETMRRVYQACVLSILLYGSVALSAATLVVASSAASSANWHSVTHASSAFLMYLLNSLPSCLYFR